MSGLDSSGAWVTVSYRYDPMGRRISSSLNNQTTLYAYDGWNVVEEYQLQPSSFILQTLHTWGLDLSGTFQGAGGVGGLLYTEDLSSGTAWHHHYDGNGNVTHLTDADATSIASYTYDAFGNTETATGPAASANKYRFSTKPIEDAIPTHPLYYYGYRFYNPETGRWLNRDPIEEKGGLNLYGFVGNDGVGRWDYLGLQSALPPGWHGPGTDYDPDANPFDNSDGSWDCPMKCILKHILGITVSSTAVVSGQPLITKRFVLPGSVEGTSIIGKMTDTVLGDLEIPRSRTIVGCCRIRYTSSASRFVSRWIPILGWVQLTVEAAKVSMCICEECGEK